MLPQRARAAENRVENRLSNGPRRVQSKAYAEYSATCEAYVSCQGYTCILHERTVNL